MDVSPGSHTHDSLLLSELLPALGKPLSNFSLSWWRGFSIAAYLELRFGVCLLFSELPHIWYSDTWIEVLNRHKNGNFTFFPKNNLLWFVQIPKEMQWMVIKPAGCHDGCVHCSAALLCLSHCCLSVCSWVFSAGICFYSGFGSSFVIVAGWDYYKCKLEKTGQRIEQVLEQKLLLLGVSFVVSASKFTASSWGEELTSLQRFFH